MLSLYFAQWIDFDGSFEITVPYDYVEIEKKILALKTIFNNQFDSKSFTIEYHLNPVLTN